LACSETLTTSTVKGYICDIKHLRKGGTTSDDESLFCSGNSLGRFSIDLDKVNEALRKFSDMHHGDKNGCNDFRPQVIDVKKQGLACSVQVQCLGKCKLKSECYYKLYDVADETRPGPKRAAINKQFGYAVQDSSLGMHGASQLMSTMDMPPLAESNCRKLAKLVSKEMTNFNDLDMTRIKRETIDDNIIRGVPDTSVGEVAISVDTRWNSVSFGNRKKMGQSATQAITTAIDCRTDKVVDFVLENKVCLIGSSLRNAGFDAQCGPTSTDHDCTRTLEYNADITEHSMNTKLGRQLVKDGLLPLIVTTDNDGQGAAPYQKIMNEIPDCHVISQSDPVHLANSQIRATIRQSFRKETFHCRTVLELKARQELLARDIKYRTSGILKQLKNEKQLFNETRVANLQAAAVQCFLRRS